ncbi:MAG: CHRD domain-containing protein [Chitinophagaceae bacterium]|nr:MAG: CHRD domain-containing protein [Chitinophagaceae bacterium]
MKTANSKKQFYFFSFLTLFFLSFHFSSNATVYPINVTLSGAQEVPANASTATGTLSGTYDDATNTLTYSVTFSGLTANATAADFHAAPPGIAAGVLIPAAGFPTGVTSGTYTPAPLVLTNTQEDSLKMGLFYFNIQNASFPGGEIRAQIFLQDASFVLPDITCPADTTLDAETGLCTAALKFDASIGAVGTPLPSFYYRIGSTKIISPYDFPVGTSTVVAIALNSAGFDTCSFTVTVNDVEVPVITCPGNITQSNDPGECGAIVTFEATATDNCSGVTVTYSKDPGTFFDVGTTTVTATATDASGNTSTCTFDVTVNDVEPPVILDLNADPNILWPPNHKLRNIPVNYTSTDNCPGPITCQITVTSDEPVNGYADGNTAPDWVIIDDHQIKLRAERAGNRDGRVYTITVSCTDQYGNTGTATTTVNVPHDMLSSVANRSIIGMKEDGQEGNLYVSAFPNPSRSYFTVYIESNNITDKISVRLFDVNGRIVEVRNNVSGSQTLRLGNNLKAGIYFAEIRQGNETKKLKLLKLD